MRERVHLSLTVLFKEASDAPKLAGYWSEPRNDALKLHKRGWPLAEAWANLTVAVRDRVGNVAGDCSFEAMLEDPLKPILRESTELVIAHLEGASYGLRMA